MPITYSDVLHPGREPQERMLDDGGALTPTARAASSGELAFARLGKAIVEEGWRIDATLRAELIRLLRAA